MHGSTTLPLLEKLLDLNEFTGKRKDLRLLLLQLRNKLEGNSDRYPTEASRLAYATSRIGGITADLVGSFNSSSVDQLVRLLEASYGDLNQ